METPIFTSVVVPILLAMVVVWFVLLRVLFLRLERQHRSKYEEMGRPSLVLRNSLASNWALLRFLVAREHRGLDDRFVSVLSDFMALFVVLYLVLFLSVAFGLRSS